MLKSGSYEYGARVVFTVAQALGVLEHLVGDAGDGHGLVQVFSHV